MRRTTGQFIIQTKAVPNSSRTPIFWTGKGWSVDREVAKKFKNAKQADNLITRMMDQWLLRDTQPAYDVDHGATIERTTP